MISGPYCFSVQLARRPLCAKLAGRLGAKLQPGVRAAVQAVLVLALLACSTVWLLNGSFQSFVYFQF